MQRVFGRWQSDPPGRVTRKPPSCWAARSGVRKYAEQFTDKAEISSWALGYVNAMASRGFMNGNQGIFNPKGLITRAEIVTVLDHAIAGLFAKPAEYTGNYSGIVVVNAPGVILRDMVIDGDLIITQGVRAGEVTLTNVSISGSMIVRSGSVKATGTTVGTAGMTGEAGIWVKRIPTAAAQFPAVSFPEESSPVAAPTARRSNRGGDQCYSAVVFRYISEGGDVGKDSINILVKSGRNRYVLCRRVYTYAVAPRVVRRAGHQRRAGGDVSTPTYDAAGGGPGRRC